MNLGDHASSAGSVAALVPARATKTTANKTLTIS
jgi:hypothetical protein